jgi:beta-galactosidase
LFPETSIGWYRKHIWISAADSCKQFQLQLDGIFRNANIWIKGIFVGNNMSGYVGAYYNITNFLKWNSDKGIEVRVDATQYGGWFYEGAGIYRHVWLNMMQPLHLATKGVYNQTKTEENIAIVLVNATIHNDAFQQRNAVVYSHVTERNGKMIATTAKQPVSIAADNSFQLQQSIPVNNPR